MSLFYSAIFGVVVAVVGDGAPEVLSQPDFAVGLGTMFGTAFLTVLSVRASIGEPSSSVGIGPARVGLPPASRLYLFLGALLSVVLCWVALYIAQDRWMSGYAPYPTWPRYVAVVITLIGGVATGLILAEGHRIYTRNHAFSHGIALTFLAVLAATIFVNSIDDKPVAVRVGAAVLLLILLWLRSRRMVAWMRSRIAGNFAWPLPRHWGVLIVRHSFYTNGKPRMATFWLPCLLIGFAVCGASSRLRSSGRLPFLNSLDLWLGMVFDMILYVGIGWIAIWLWRRLLDAGPRYTRWLVLPLAWVIAVLGLSVSAGGTVVYALVASSQVDECVQGSWVIDSITLISEADGESPGEGEQSTAETLIAYQREGIGLALEFKQDGTGYFVDRDVWQTYRSDDASQAGRTRAGLPEMVRVDDLEMRAGYLQFTFATMDGRIRMSDDPEGGPRITFDDSSTTGSYFEKSPPGLPYICFDDRVAIGSPGERVGLVLTRP